MSGSGRATHLCVSRQENEKKCVFQRTECFVGYPVDSQNEIVFEKDIAHNGEEVDEDKSQHGCQNNGAAIAGHTLYYVQQGLLSVNQIKELERGRIQRCVSSTCVENVQGNERGVCVNVSMWANKGHCGKRTQFFVWIIALFKSPCQHLMVK